MGAWRIGAMGVLHSCYAHAFFSREKKHNKTSLTVLMTREREFSRVSEDDKHMGFTYTERKCLNPKLVLNFIKYPTYVILF